MRKPTPVIIKRKRLDSWSIWKAKSILKELTSINENKGSTGKAMPVDFTCTKSIILTISEASIEPQPIMLVRPFDNCFLKRPFIKNPSSGNNGTR
jgi:hypothetical protein